MSQLTGLLERIREALQRSVVLPTGEDATLVTLWIAHTHVFRKFRFTPRLIVTAADRSCGKSRLLDVLEGLCADVARADDFTAAVLNRYAPAGHTLLWDEADVKLNVKAGESQYLALFNGGFCATGARAYCEPDEKGAYKLRKRSTFAPLAVCGVGLALPGTSESRSIRVEMQKRPRGREVLPVDPVELEKLRTDLSKWANKWQPGDRAPLPPLQDRTRDFLVSFAALAAEAGGEWPEALWRAAEALDARIAADAEAEPAVAVAVLQTLLSLWPVSGPDAYRTSTLAEMLNGSLVTVQDGLRDGVTVWTAHRLASVLRSFRLRPSRYRDASGVQFRGFSRVELQEAGSPYMEDGAAD